MRVIVALSGGKSSAWCANWAFKHYPKECVILYFNDTRWEHPDLYRFLDDLSNYFDHPIIHDSDGRTPEELFYDHRALANSRMPFCSYELKAKRLQRFFEDGDILIFGIGSDEAHRAQRLITVYKDVAERRKSWAKLVFPLIQERVTKYQIDEFLKMTGIAVPLLYRLGFPHNNCSGGCVRAGRKQWKLLYETLPDVFADRERVEREVREYIGKDVSFLPGETLEELRKRIELQGRLFEFSDGEEGGGECIGICSRMV